MNVYITAKQIRKRGDQIASYPCVLDPVPDTLRQLIFMLVSDGVDGYNRRLDANDDQRVLEKDAMDAMSQVGKIAFGIPFGSRKAVLQDALETAYQGFEDGLFRIFLGEREIEFLDEPLHLQEEDTITIIRLVMLTGGYI